MTIVALISLLPSLIQGAGEVANIIQEMQATGSSQTTAEQDTRLATALANRRGADGNYDALPVV